VERADPRFMERRQWEGVVQVRLKSQSSISISIASLTP